MPNSLQDVVEDVWRKTRWNYHVTRYELGGDKQPLYLNDLPSWRFEQLLADSDETWCDMQQYNSATGEGLTRPKFHEIDPVEASADYASNVPADLAPTVLVLEEDGDLRYRTDRLEWDAAGDDITGFSTNTASRRYKGVISGADIERYQQSILAPPETYSLIDRSDIPSEQANDVIPRNLADLDNVHCRIPQTLATAENDKSQSSTGFASALLPISPETGIAFTTLTGEKAAGLWTRYGPDSEQINSAEGQVETTADRVRYSVKVDSTDSYHNSDTVFQFWTTASKTPENTDRFLNYLHA